MTANAKRIFREIAWGFIITAVFIQTMIIAGWLKWLI